MGVVQRVLRDPFIHFAVLGAGVFLWYGTVNPQDEEAAPEKEIVLSTAQIPALTARFQASLQRPATPEDVQDMLNRLVREEIMVREARGLSLEQNDPVIRQRLAQKMRFLTDAAAQSAVPTQDELQTFYEQNQAEYASTPSVTFQQVYLSDQPEAAAKVIAALEAGSSPRELGATSMLAPGLQDASQRMVESRFGRGFFEQITAQKVGQWQGPVTSTFGAHVVLVEALTPARVPELVDVQDRVLADWRRDRSDSLQEELFKELEAQYRVVVPDMSQIREAMGL